MIPLEFLRAANLSEVCGLGLLLPIDNFGETFLVTSGEQAMAVFLTGQFAGHAFPLSMAENWVGLVIEQLEMQVDLSTAYSVDKDGPKLGSIIIEGNRSNIVASVKDGGWTQTQRIPLGESVKLEAGACVVGFLSWQLVRRQNHETHVMHRFGGKFE